MNSKLTGRFPVMVSYVGRVKAGIKGPVAKFDYLKPSTVSPGKLMKSMEKTRIQALESSLENEKGIIDVVIR